MYIINNNNEYIAEKNTKFTIVFQDAQGCGVVAKELIMLTSDDWAGVWQFFQGKEAKQLLSTAISGLVVFLTCTQKENIITGEFFSLDSLADGKLLASYVHEAQNDALVDIGGQVLVA